MNLVMVPSNTPNSQQQANPRKVGSENIVIKQVLDDLTRYRRDLGESHEKVAETWNSLGLIRLHMQQDAHGAKHCFEEALRIFEQIDSQASIAITLNDLGCCLERLQENEKAISVYQKARQLLEAEKYSATHPRMLSTERSISRLLRK